MSRLGDSMHRTFWHPRSWKDYVVIVSVGYTGWWLVNKVYNFAKYHLSKQPPAQRVARPTIEPDPVRVKEQKEKLEKYYTYTPVAPSPLPADSSASLPQPQFHSMLDSLTIHGVLLSKDEDLKLAEPLRAYQALKHEMEVDEERFAFIAKAYCSSNPLPDNRTLPLVLNYPAKNTEISLDPELAVKFRELDQKLRQAGLKLEDMQEGAEPLGKAKFKNGTSKDLRHLTDLYETVKHLGPHILSPGDVKLKQEQVRKTKETLYKGRLEIINKTLSILMTTLVNDFLQSFQEKYKDYYKTFFNEKSEDLRFVVENICWHVLDRALETLETKFTPTKEKQLKDRRQELETLLNKSLQDGETKSKAHGLLVEILTGQNDERKILSLVNVLLGEKDSNPSKTLLVESLQKPDSQLDEERLQQEIDVLETFGQAYDRLDFGLGVIEAGKSALLKKRPQAQKKKLVTERPKVSPDSSLTDSFLGVRENPNSFSYHIDQLSQTVVGACGRGVQAVAGLRWTSYTDSLEKALQTLPFGDSVLDPIIKNGWVKSSDNLILMDLTGPQKWMITQAMLLRKLVPGSIETKGREFVKEVGSWIAIFGRTLLGRSVSALLAFEQRSREKANSPSKPADCIAEAMISPLVKSFEALQTVKTQSTQPMHRENAVVNVLGNSLHPSASNKPSADFVFLGKLILDLLSILQPKGLSSDVYQAFVKALSKSGAKDTTILDSFIENYKNSLTDETRLWVRAFGHFLIDALQIFFEKKSAKSIANLMSDWLHPATINGYLVDFLIQAPLTSEVPDAPKPKDPLLQWHPDEEARVKQLETDRATLKKQIELCEKQIADLEKERDKLKKESIDVRMVLEGLKKTAEDLINLKTNLFKLDFEIAPMLIRRLVIKNVIPVLPTGTGSLAPYILQFGTDIFELLQYPRILRNIFFPVLEKTVLTLAQHLEELDEKALLNSPMELHTDVPVMDFLFSDNLKTDFGTQIFYLISKLSPLESRGNLWGFFAKGLAKTVTTTGYSGYYLFLAIQTQIQGVIAKKFGNEANQWTVGKLVNTFETKIKQFSEDNTNQGLQALVETQLKKALEPPQPLGQPQPLGAQLPIDGTPGASSPAAQRAVVSVIVADGK